MACDDCWVWRAHTGAVGTFCVILYVTFLMFIHEMKKDSVKDQETIQALQECCEKE